MKIENIIRDAQKHLQTLEAEFTTYYELHNDEKKPQDERDYLAKLYHARADEITAFREHLRILGFSSHFCSGLWLVEPTYQEG